MRQEAWADNTIGLMHIDVSRTYFHAPDREDKYVEIPSDDWEADGSDVGICGKLNVSLYGTRDAARNSEDAYAGTLLHRLGQRTSAQSRGSW